MTGDGLKNNVLDLPPECLLRPTRLHVATLEVVMLWPHDSAARTRALRTSTVENLRMNRPLLKAQLDPDMFDLAASATPVKDMTESAKEPYVRGIIAGFVLAETVGKIALGVADASVGDAIEVASKTFWPRYRVLPKTINNTIWPRYKTVAHLWAAHWLLFKAGDFAAFPCDCSELGAFLATAEGFRQLGEATRTFKSPARVLPPGAAVGLPFAVPTAILDFELAGAR